MPASKQSKGRLALNTGLAGVIWHPERSCTSLRCHLLDPIVFVPPHHVIESYEPFVLDFCRRSHKSEALLDTFHTKGIVVPRDSTIRNGLDIGWYDGLLVVVFGGKETVRAVDEHVTEEEEHVLFRLQER
jgi:hypothetical protein